MASEINHKRLPEANGTNQKLPLAEPEDLDDIDAGAKESRESWGGKLDFIFSCLSYAVGLGNVWRFPYLCYENGGGAFLIPYTVSLLLMGLPVFFMELSFGQYASLGPISVWSISPLFTGAGYAMVAVSFFIGIYYNMLNAYSFFYLVHSLRWKLPWTECGNEWNTEACAENRHQLVQCQKENGSLLMNGSCILGVVPEELQQNLTSLVERPRSPSDEYFHRFMLDISGDISDIGGIKWKLAVCLLVAWTLVFLCMLRGIKISGKATYFTALFPYVVLTILLVRGCTLPGSSKGLEFYLYPKWKHLLTAKVWGDAAVQIFFDLSPCWGGLIALASYNKFHNNVLRDAFIVSFGNCITSVYAGFAIFSLVGYMAYVLHVDVEEVVAKGPGLAFIAYPAGLAHLPGAPVFAALFFIMLLCLGIGTQFTIVETVVTALSDEFPKLFKTRKWMVLLVVCSGSYVLGLFLCSKGGLYILNLLDNYSGTWSVLIIGLVESLVISWIYGVDRFLENIKHMLKRPVWLRIFWKVVWKYVCPFLILVILVFTFLDYEVLSYDERDYPGWADGVGWIVSLISVMAIPVMALVKLCQVEGPLLQRFRKLLRPTPAWGPASEQHRKEANFYMTAESSGPDAAISLTSKPVDQHQNGTN